MEILSTAKIAPEGKVNIDDLKRIGMNIVIFTAPALAVFFAQLALKVPVRDAALVAILALYGIAADFFRKLKQTP